MSFNIQKPFRRRVAEAFAQCNQERWRQIEEKIASAILNEADRMGMTARDQTGMHDRHSNLFPGRSAFLGHNGYQLLRDMGLGFTMINDDTPDATVERIFKGFEFRDEDFPAVPPAMLQAFERVWVMLDEHEELYDHQKGQALMEEYLKDGNELDSSYLYKDLEIYAKKRLAHCAFTVLCEELGVTREKPQGLRI